MLLGKDFGRGQENGLVPGVNNLQHRSQRDEGFSRANFSLQ